MSDTSPDAPIRTSPGTSSDSSPGASPGAAPGFAPPPRALRRNWRLLEVLVAMSILVTLAGLLVPYTVRVGERTRLENAEEDLATIASSLSSFADDIHHGTLEARFANGESAATGDETSSEAEGDALAATDVSWLRGPGELPAGAPFELVEQSEPLDRLSVPRSIADDVRGPLLLALRPDPWGSAYLLRLDGLGQGTSRSMVYSAGPDRVLHTADDLRHSID